MITLRCTAKAAKALGFARFADPTAGTSPLGDWYANLVPSAGGSAFIFMNERSLLAVVVPVTERSVLHSFVMRVANLLSMIGVPNERIEEELVHFRDMQIGKTASRTVLGVMNDCAYRFQEAIESATPEAKLSLSDFELELANMPQSTLRFRLPKAIAIELLAIGGDFGAA